MNPSPADEGIRRAFGFIKSIFMNFFRILNRRGTVVLALLAGVLLGGSAVLLFSGGSGSASERGVLHEAGDRPRHRINSDQLPNRPMQTRLGREDTDSESATRTSKVHSTTFEANTTQNVSRPPHYDEATSLPSGFSETHNSANPYSTASAGRGISAPSSGQSYAQSAQTRVPVANETASIVSPSGVSGAASTNSDSGPAAIPLDPSLAGNSLTTSGQQVAVESVQQTPDGTNLDLAISPAGETPANARQNGRPFTLQQELFRAKWGWENYDLAMRAAQEAARSSNP